MKLRHALACLTLIAAAPLHAGGYLVPGAGVATGGNVDDSKATYTGSLMFAGDSSVVGFEVDFGYTPHFFGKSLLGKNNVTTLMGDLVLISPGSVRIYGSGGLGLLKTHVEDAGGFFDVDSNDLGVNVGGGLIVLPGDGRIGLRGDVRYFRSLTDPERDDNFDVDFGDLDYWRVTGGLVIKF